MKQRLFSGWSLTRVLYLGIGLLMMVQSVMDRQWLGLMLGSYLAAMGIFALGCAGGNCVKGNCVVPRQNEATTKTMRTPK